MSDLAAMVNRLIEAGTPPGLAAEIAAEIFVAGVQAAPLRVDAAAERRREKDRERKRNVRRLPQTSADSADMDLNKKVPPITPLKNKPPSEANASLSPKRSKGARLPDDWQPSESLFLFGSELGFAWQTTASELARMADHFRAAPGQRGVKNDWNATARNWLRKAAEMRGPKPSYYQPGGVNDGKAGNVIDAADRLLERLNSFDKPISPDAGGGEGEASVRLLSKG